MKKILLSISILTLILFSLNAMAENVTVELSHNSLKPASVSISAGDTVTFQNVVEMPGGHTIVSIEGSFESPALAKGESWSHTFEKAGTFKYQIKEHPDNMGEVVVK